MMTCACVRACVHACIYMCFCEDGLRSHVPASEATGSAASSDRSAAGIAAAFGALAAGKPVASCDAGPESSREVVSELN